MAVPGSPIPGKLFPIPMVHLSTHFITTAAALRLSNFLSHRANHSFLLSSYKFQNTSRLGCFHYLRDIWSVEVLNLPGLSNLQLSYDAVSSIIVSSYFGGGNEYHNESSGMMKGHSNASRRVSVNGRNWTNLLLVANVLMYIAQNTTKGRLLYWGAKINSLIDKGQLWRLVTASFLHANIGHLLINCYSLNSVGPAIEKISGPRRFLAVYLTSAIAGCGMSYWLSKAPAVGASGAISGLVGSLAIFTLRHKDMVKGGKQDLQHILRVIAVNMVMGVVLKGIDNWGHLGGLIGGAAISWLLGPALKFEYVPGYGQKVLVDRAPIFTLRRIIRTSK